MRCLFAGSPEKYFDVHLIATEECAQAELLKNFRRDGGAEAIELDQWLSDRDSIPNGWKRELYVLKQSRSHPS